MSVETNAEYTVQKLKKYMTKYGLINQNWGYSFNNRKRCAGLCSYKNKTIYISKYYIFSETVSKKDIKNTILHEIAHALVGSKQGHNEVWQKKAIEIGCNGKRCCEKFNEDFKYYLVCKYGCRVGRHKNGKIMKGAYTCKKHGKPIVLENMCKFKLKL